MGEKSPNLVTLLGMRLMASTESVATSFESVRPGTDAMVTIFCDF
jgi:hypothetical protein